MDCCGDPRDGHFGEPHAVRDLKRYLGKGPDRTTVHILEGLRALDLRGVRLLDIGAGVGVIHHELLEDICLEATHVDLSTAYVETARQETSRRGHDGRVKFVMGDFASEEMEVPDAEIVTLDRVVCCYPDFRGLLSRSARRATRVLALSYPRDRWATRVALWLSNFKRVLTGDPFRAFVHPVAELEGFIEGNGFSRVEHRDTFFWRSSIYRRPVVS